MLLPSNHSVSRGDPSGQRISPSGSVGRCFSFYLASSLGYRPPMPHSLQTAHQRRVRSAVAAFCLGSLGSLATAQADLGSFPKLTVGLGLAAGVQTGSPPPAAAAHCLPQASKAAFCGVVALGPHWPCLPLPVKPPFHKPASPERMHHRRSPIASRWHWRSMSGRSVFLSAKGTVPIKRDCSTDSGSASVHR